MIFADVVFGIISLVISIWFFIMSQGFKSGTVSDGVPGAGFFPSILCIIMGIVSIVLIIQGFKKKTHYFTVVKHIKDISENTKNLFLTSAALLIFMLLWQYTFFILALAVLIFFLNLLFHQKILINILYTGILVSVIYLVFGRIFHVMF